MALGYFASFACLAPPARLAYIPPVRRTHPDTDSMATNPIQFLQQTRSEVSKVVWPTRREVLVTTLMVFALAIVGAAFFSVVDILIRKGLELILTMSG